MALICELDEQRKSVMPLINGDASN
ncbi:hypothetical protein Asd1617_06283 (plasmid) [Shigella dysenteriae 1617]|uniref:Uncharacterized protein n=1 Tax=Shigella dysenteriae 1617 TaxID=754093 RepID=A0A0A7A4K6_SHIDY|nr:hypothetical protein Asd1617_06283 [Shigella dysenteriae 1617]